MTPIVRNADQKTISSISSEVLNLFFTIRDTNDPNLIDHLISRARLGLRLGPKPTRPLCSNIASLRAGLTSQY